MNGSVHVRVNISFQAWLFKLSESDIKKCNYYSRNEGRKETAKPTKEPCQTPWSKAILLLIVPPFQVVVDYQQTQRTHLDNIHGHLRDGNGSP